MAFNALAEYSSGYGNMAISLAQINTDGQLDLVLVENSQVVIRYGNPDGSFGDPFTTGAQGALDALIADDVNQDDIADLVSGTYGYLAIQLGNGDGSFQQPQILAIPNQLEAAITGPAWSRRHCST